MYSLKIVFLSFFFFFLVLIGGCSTDKNINRAKLAANRYWTDKAYPGKAFDVQVVDAVKVDDGKYRVKAMVDGESRVGLFNPETENFDEGFYSLSHERGKKIAELEEESRYLKDKVEKLEKENYQLKLRLKYVKAGKVDPNTIVDPDTATKRPTGDPKKGKIDAEDLDDDVGETSKSTEKGKVEKHSAVEKSE